MSPLKNYTNDVGVAAAYAKTLLVLRREVEFRGQAKTTGKALLDGAVGATTRTARVSPFRRLGRTTTGSTTQRDQGLYVPSGWTGTMPNGDAISSSSTFTSMRSFYKSDPAWSKIQSYLDGWRRTDVHVSPVLGSGGCRIGHGVVCGAS
jgi:hypothetical protein